MVGDLSKLTRREKSLYYPRSSIREPKVKT